MLLTAIRTDSVPLAQDYQKQHCRKGNKLVWIWETTNEGENMLAIFYFSSKLQHFCLMFPNKVWGVLGLCCPFKPTWKSMPKRVAWTFSPAWTDQDSSPLSRGEDNTPVRRANDFAEVTGRGRAPDPSCKQDLHMLPFSAQPKLCASSKRWIPTAEGVGRGGGIRNSNHYPLYWKTCIWMAKFTSCSRSLLDLWGSRKKFIRKT